MASKHRTQIIKPFPSGINRQHFASWLSGFTDGEGCFFLGFNKKKTGHIFPHAHFAVALRFDDRPVLELFQSFFQCGNVTMPYFHNSMKSGKHTSKPRCTFYVRVFKDLHRVIIPHFSKYPLMAKKQRDFEIWKNAVDFMRSVYPGLEAQKHVPRTHVFWTKDKLEMFNQFVVALKELRKPYHS